jgi:D-alanine-D-alanine ligase-like ATP-grasp enzyme
MTLPVHREAPLRFLEGSDGYCLIEALTARQIQYRYLERSEAPRKPGPIIAFSIAGETYYFDGRLRRGGTEAVPGPHIHGDDADSFVNDKGLIKAFLRKNGFSVPAGRVFDYDSADEAEQFFTDFVSSRKEGVCVKPRRGCHGKRVHIGIQDLESFRAAFRNIGKGHVVVEEAVQGQMYRILCVGGRAIAALAWRTMNVKGDGRHSIAELIERKNAKRRANPAYADFPLCLDEEELRFLREAGLGPDCVPPSGQRVFLRPRPNEDEATDATEELHPSYKELIERALGLLPPLPICGADLIIRKACAPAASDNHFILELNVPARFVDHHYPWKGQPRDAAGAIVEHLLRTRQTAAWAQKITELRLELDGV